MKVNELLENTVREEGEGEAGAEANLATPNKKMKKILLVKVAPQMNPYIRKKKVDESPRED